MRDHDHVSGAFRGAAHNSCYLQYRLLRKKNKDDDDSYVIPIIFHNLRSYDGHHIMEKLVHNLVQEGKHKFKNMNKFIPERQDLLLRKGVYPYDYVDGPNKLQATSLPSKQDFYSLLSKLHILDDDYMHAHRDWEAFRCKTFGDYHDNYLKSDVLQLADVFENVQRIFHHNYGLDQAHYYTAQGLSWDAMLRYTKVKLEVITDIDMYLMIEKGIRGGVSVITHKYDKANNGSDYKGDEPTSYFILGR